MYYTLNRLTKIKKKKSFLWKSVFVLKLCLVIHDIKILATDEEIY